MNTFQHRSVLRRRTIGEKLRRARKLAGYSITQIATEIRIKPDYLSSLENGQYNKLPSPVFIKNYLKNYSRFLGLSWPSLEEQYEEEMVIFRQKNHNQRSTKFSQKALVIPRIVFIVIVILVITALAVYLISEITNLTQPPPLVINNLPEQFTSTEHNIVISGKTSKKTQVFINDQEIIVDQDGNFTEEISLQNGLNTIKVTAKRSHSKERIVYRQIFVKNN